MTERLALILDGAAEGPWNMAVDEALLESAAQSGLVCLRFYGWRRPTLSLGYFQPCADRAGHAASGDCPLVRRSTGGGAIVHDRELTYSLCAPLDSANRFDAPQLYEAVHGALVDELSRQQIKAVICDENSAQAPAQAPFLCFQRRTAGDVLLGSSKIAGSAQRRRKGAVLQHGSLLWRASACAPELPGLAELLGAESIEMQSFARKWTDRLAERLSLRPARTMLSDEVLRLANRLQATKFDTPAWNQRR